jgi:hypothetical protein
MIHQSKVKTKALQWTKMNQNNVSKTVWGSKTVDEIALEMELKEKGVFDGVEELFAQKVFEPKKIIKREKKPQVCIIDSKKAYNINIALLAKLKRTPFEEVRKRILAVDFDFCTEILLRNMVGLAPTPDEMGKLSVFASSAGEEDLESLSPADRFCLEVRFESSVELAALSDQGTGSSTGVVEFRRRFVSDKILSTDDEDR